MADIIITSDDLKDPAIDDVVNLQKSAQNAGGQRIEEIKTPFYYNPMFYYAIAATLGALIIWAINEPFINEKNPEKFHMPFVSDYLLFGPVAGAIGFAIGVVYGLVNRKPMQALYCGVVGAGVSLGVTIITTIVADILFGIIGQIAYASMRDLPRDPNPDEFPLKGISFFIFMCGRALAWSIISMGSGLGLGIALKSKKLVLNGFVGGMIGGLIGGLFFDPIYRFLHTTAETGWLSRLVGIAAVGMFSGLFIGLIENLSKEAWFLMLKGPLTGKQFILFKSPMLIGSSPKSDIYLFKDADIAPLHAKITKAGSRYMLSDEGSDKGTYVNGKRVEKYILQPNDTITIGEAVLRYAEKARG